MNVPRHVAVIMDGNGRWAKKNGVSRVAGHNQGMLAMKEIIKKADLYAQKIGLAFQIIDDILDVTSTTEELGKPVGSDAEQNKTTFVTLMGIESAKKEADKLTKEALMILDSFDESDFLKALTIELLDRRK